MLQPSRVHTLDLMFLGQQKLIASYVIETSAGLMLIETGPTSCHEHLFSGLKQLGASPRDVKTVLVTHIHLDHSGAAGMWAQQGAEVYVHHRGRPHLLDPSKLIESATQIYGDRMHALWGTTLPAPAERVHAVTEGDHITLGDVTLEVWDTPGHARHHAIFHTDGLCFCGDQAGMRYPGTDYLSVTSAPPQFEPPAYIASVQRMLGAGFSSLYLTHWGAVQEVQSHLSAYAQRLQQVTDQVQSWVLAGRTSEEIALQYGSSERAAAAAAGLSDEHWAAVYGANNTTMCAAGIERWVRKQLPS
jgi:glyoxylase-like metal-dependent hydrolase (beta-lactamase superfamily II)